MLWGGGDWPLGEFGGGLYDEGELLRYVEGGLLGGGLLGGL